MSTSADEIRKRMNDHFVRLAELDGREIRVQPWTPASCIEGAVHSVIEVSGAECRP